MAGWVYILTNPGLPGVVKIGQTSRGTRLRMAELLREYGTALPFELASRHAVDDPAAVEELAHRRLARCRLAASELFRCDAATAQEAVLWAARATLGRPGWLRWLNGLTRRRRPSWGRYRRRGDGSWLLVCLALCAIAAVLVIWQPTLPRWLPSAVWHTGYILEHLRR